MSDGELQILQPRTSIKVFKLEPSFKNEEYNGFLSDYAAKSKSEI